MEPRLLRKGRHVLLGVAVPLALALGATHVAAGGAPAEATASGAGGAPDDVGSAIRYEDDRLSADVTDMGLHAMLNEIGRQSGARVRIEGVADRSVSERFTRLPLHEALRRVLGEEENFSLTYTQASDGRSVEARLKELRVYGAGGPTATAAPERTEERRAARGDDRSLEGSLMEGFSKLLDRHSDIELRSGSPLVAAMGGERVSLQDVMNVAMRDDDPALRAEAAGELARVVDSDAGAVALLGAGNASGINPDTIAAVLHASGGAHAEEFLGHMAKRLRTPALRVRANQVLGRLRRLQ